MRLIHEITLRNLLSFGPDTPTLPMHDLNLLIGPNGSGKSNLIAAVSLLKAAPTHLAKPVRESGGVGEWVWKGNQCADAAIEAVVDYAPTQSDLNHFISFSNSSGRFELTEERITTYSGRHRPLAEHYVMPGGPDAMISVKGKRTVVPRAELSAEESVLSQRKDPESYPEITWLGSIYARIQVYGEWSFGRNNTIRHPQRADLRNDRLEPDGSNFGLVLNRLRGDAKAKKSLLDNLRELYDGIEDYDVAVRGNTVEVFFQESGRNIPAIRLSDGTLRYLFLLAILCDPAPPPLVCIEEPELGLHPDILPTLARLMQQASERCQLIVTTHSDILVDAFTDTPECVVVCEKHDGQTRMNRLDSKDLAKWLDKYRLGDLWTQGQIGGTRW